MLREVVLASEDVGCDMQLQHDHLIILGDLNYRMNTPPVPKGRGRQNALGEGQSSLLSIASAAFAERSALGDDPHWVRRKYGLFYGPESPMYIPPEERELLVKAENIAASYWDAVIQYDEMIEMMRIGEVFFGFKEVPPRFPPTYKRKKGPAGDCGDYTSFSELVQGYSHTGEEPNELDEMDDSTRSTTSLGSLSELDESFNGTTTRESESKVPFSTIEDTIETGSDSQEIKIDSGSMQASEAENAPIEGSAVKFNLPEASSPTVATERPKPNRRASMFTMRRGSSLGTLDDEKKKEEKRKSKLRPPSYTDRIIVHSLQDNNKLIPQGYGFCDSYRASDHRPVCMAMTLEVCIIVMIFPLTLLRLIQRLFPQSMPQKIWRQRNLVLMLLCCN